MQEHSTKSALLRETTLALGPFYSFINVHSYVKKDDSKRHADADSDRGVTEAVRVRGGCKGRDKL